MPRLRRPRGRARDLGARVLTVRTAQGVSAFYDSLAGSYHLIYADWRKDVARQGAVLDRLLRSILGGDTLDVLDCACGIGTQAIGLAARGHRVRATDISEASVERARREAEAFGVDVALSVADLRELAAHVPTGFDAAIACDNVLPHLVTDEDLRAAAGNIAAVLRPGGVFVASVADYDEAVGERRRAGTPQVFDGPDGTRVLVNVLDWAPDGRTYGFTLIILRRGETGWTLEHHTTVERALLRTELTGILAGAGFAAIRWYTTDETGFFQPIVTARRP